MKKCVLLSLVLVFCSLASTSVRAEYASCGFTVDPDAGEDLLDYVPIISTIKASATNPKPITVCNMALKCVDKKPTPGSGWPLPLVHALIAICFAKPDGTCPRALACATTDSALISTRNTSVPL